MPTDLYADADRMADHWWWRPGWQVGTRFYTWHITLGGQSHLHALIDQYQAALRGFPTLDPVPRPWRHVTMQGLGHVQDINDADRDAVVNAVRHRLAAIRPFAVTYQRASIFTEAVVLPPSEPDAIIDLRHAIRAGIADALGPNRVPDPATGYRPHITITYSNAEATARRIRLALDQAGPHLATAQITTASLIRLHRDRRMYEWMTVAAVSLGKQTQHLPA